MNEEMNGINDNVQDSAETALQEDPVNDIQEDAPGTDDTGNGDGKEPEIFIRDGEVNFSGDFFDDVPENKPEKPSGEDNNDTGENAGTEKKETVNYYTDEELQNTPAESWDKARMPEDVRRYYEAYQRQLENHARQQRVQQEIQQRVQTPPAFLREPKKYTPKELNEEAMKIAAEKLGLKSSDELDDYDAEHRAALDIARSEILQKNSAETADYNHKTGEYKNWQIFSGQLAAQPDFNEFGQWYLEKVRKNGNTVEQVNAELMNIAKMQGFGTVQQIWTEFYRRFRAYKAQAQNKPVARTRAKTPPTLESTQGGSQNNRKTYSMREFGQLDDDAQAQALIDMGIV